LVYTIKNTSANTHVPVPTVPYYGSTVPIMETTHVYYR